MRTKDVKIRRPRSVVDTILMGVTIHIAFAIFCTTGSSRLDHETVVIKQSEDSGDSCVDWRTGIGRCTNRTAHTFPRSLTECIPSYVSLVSRTKINVAHMKCIYLRVQANQTQ